MRSPVHSFAATPRDVVVRFAVHVWDDGHVAKTRVRVHASDNILYSVCPHAKPSHYVGLCNRLVVDSCDETKSILITSRIHNRIFYDRSDAPNNEFVGVTLIRIWPF